MEQLFNDDSLDLDCQVVWYCRSLTRGVPRHYKHTHLLRHWLQAQAAGNVFEASVIFAFFLSAPEVMAPLRAPFNLNALSDDVCVKNFRFNKRELATLVSLMEVDDIVTRKRTKATGMEAAVQTSGPDALGRLECFFGRSPSGLSNIFLNLLDQLDSQFSRTLDFSGDLLSGKLSEFSEAIFAAGAPSTNIWCFIDGTVRGICRPQQRKVCGKRKYLTQQSMCNGHKRKHGLKFQSLVTPDGMISHLFGPFPGRSHDIKMYRASCIAGKIRADERFQDYRIFGDCAYGRDDVMLSPFEGAIGDMTAAQLQIIAAWVS